MSIGFECARRSRPRHWRLLLALPITTCLAASLLAHEFWIEPAAYTLEPKGELALRLRVGEHFEGKPFPRKPEHLARFFLQGKERAWEIEGQAGDDPAGRISVEERGTLLVGYRGNPSFIELGAKEFEAYLRSEGLEHIIALRAERGENDKPGRESYSRCAKCIVHCGSDPAPRSGYDRPLDLTLELIPEQDPGALRRGDALRVRVLLDGKPREGQLVKAWPKAAPKRERGARSDKDGRAEIPIDATGPWLLSTVHMARAPAGVDADWRSIWSSLTFEVPAEERLLPETPRE